MLTLEETVLRLSWICISFSRASLTLAEALVGKNQLNSRSTSASLVEALDRQIQLFILDLRRLPSWETLTIYSDPDEL